MGNNHLLLLQVTAIDSVLVTALLFRTYVSESRLNKLWQHPTHAAHSNSGFSSRL